jgi:outer membrane lipoprotein-sorting protein
MSMFSRRPRLRWVVPVLAAVVLAGGGSAVGVITAAARSGLPHRSAAQLLVDVQNARLDGLSGTVVQNADLGLPSLPGVGGNGSSDLTSMVAGSHTLRLWYAGPRHVRLSLLGSLGESDVIRSGTDLWQWSSATKSATHRSVPAGLGGEGRSLASVSPVTPQQAADAALKAITPSTRVSTDGTAVVAGRSAYELVLRPRDTTSLVGSVRIAVDGRTHVPMRVQVFPRSGGKPAFEVGFTSFDPTAPDSSVFRFNPPPGTRVTRAPALAGPGPSAPSAPSTPSAPSGSPAVHGTGWASVVVARLPRDTGASGSPSVSRMLRVLPRVHGSWGSGHLLRGRLFSAVATDDGRVAVGAVAPQVLYRYLQR